MIDDRASHTIATIAGVPVRVHFSYYAFVGAILLVCGTMASTDKLILMLYVLIGTFCAVLAHELGHAFVANRLKHKVRDIMIFPIGGIAEIEMDRAKHNDVMKIAAAGPLVNICIGIILCLVPTPWAWSAGLINLFLGVGNLLPVKSFDGGLIVHAAVSKHFNEKRADEILRRMTILIVCAIAATGFYLTSWVMCSVALFVFIYGSLTDTE